MEFARPTGVITKRLLWRLLLFCGLAATLGAQEIEVRSAFYGRGRNVIDVTSQVQDFALEGAAFTVRNETFGEDPAPGQRKRLTVTYVTDGRQLTEQIEEYQTFRFRLPRPGVGGVVPVPERRSHGPEFFDDEGERGPPVRIVQALYGVHGRYADVTWRVRELARAGGRFEVSNETFGVDPYKGEGKRLKVIFQGPDGTFEKRWEEHDRVRLP